MGIAPHPSAMSLQKTPQIAPYAPLFGRFYRNPLPGGAAAANPWPGGGRRENERRFISPLQRIADGRDAKFYRDATGYNGGMDVEIYDPAP